MDELAVLYKDILSECESCFEINSEISLVLNAEFNYLSNLIGAKTTAGNSIYSTFLVDPARNSEMDQISLNCMIEKLARASSSTPLGQMRNQLLSFTGLTIELVAGVITSPIPGDTLAAGTAFDRYDSKIATIFIDLALTNDNTKTTKVIDAFLAKFPSSYSTFVPDQMGYFMHELGHVWSANTYPTAIADTTLRTKAETNRSEAHAQRWESHFYRDFWGFGIKFSANDYKYLNDWPPADFIPDFSKYVMPYDPVP